MGEERESALGVSSRSTRSPRAAAREGRSGSSQRAACETVQSSESSLNLISNAPWTLWLSILMLPSFSKLTATSVVLSQARRASRRVEVGASERAKCKNCETGRLPRVSMASSCLLGTATAWQHRTRGTHGLRRGQRDFIAFVGWRVERGGRTVGRLRTRSESHAEGLSRV
ncbi:hypothetical protein BJY59DRAFT_510527 [Rhodotorula toruloides]